MTSLEQLVMYREVNEALKSVMRKIEMRVLQTETERDALHAMVVTLLSFAKPCTLDLEFFLKQCGPGPDRRLEDLQQAMQRARNLLDACKQSGV